MSSVYCRAEEASETTEEAPEEIKHGSDEDMPTEDDAPKAES